jgi:hypothetical protein
MSVLASLLSPAVAGAPISIPAPVLPGMDYLKLDRRLEGKYFHEPVGHEKGADDRLGHYDTRYFHGMVTDEERVETLHHMVRAYLDFFRENQLETWIAHGTLLGWWWNSKLLPWDWDVDTQVRDTTLVRLANEFNQTMSHYVSADKKYEREYMLDINPWAYFRDNGPGHNIIDARWIDTTNGLYIDITALSVFDPRSKPDQWECKNHHKYKTEDLFPLRESSFEGVVSMVPYKYQEMLLEEYSLKSLTRTNYENHTWYPEQGQWVFNG